MGLLNRDNTITIDGVDVRVVCWGVISADGAREYPLDEYAYAHEFAMAVDGHMAPIVDVRYV